MTPATILSLIPMLLGLIAVEPAGVEQTVTRLVAQDEVIMRIRIGPHPFGPPIQWVERKGPKCIPVHAIRGALLLGRDRMDFLLGNHTRIRAELDEDCPALDYYGDFYLQPNGDQLCAKRDAIHSRMGGSCMIKRFSVLVPRFARQSVPLGFPPDRPHLP